MTLAEMRSMLRDNCFDLAGDFLNDARADRYLNAAVQHIANWADSLRQGLFLRSAVANNLTGSDEGISVKFYGADPDTFQIDPTVHPFRRLLSVWRTNYENGYAELDVINAEDRHKHRDGTTQALPRCFVFGQRLSLIRPTNGINLQMDYFHGLPPMQQAEHTPGETGLTETLGAPNLLPPEYHPIVVSHATLQALAAMKAPVDNWPALYGEQREELLASLRDVRRGKA